MRNSWDVTWGDNGFMTIKMTGTNGAKCNNIAAEAGILDTGVDPAPAPNPVAPGFWAGFGDFLKKIGALLISPFTMIPWTGILYVLILLGALGAIGGTVYLAVRLANRK